jgi:hypothetical protein
MRGLANAGARLGRCAVGLAMIGCTPEDVVIEPPPPPYEGLYFASCVAEPGALAHVPGVLPGLLGIDDVNLYVVASAGTDGSGAQSLWRVPKDNSPPRRLVTSETPIRSITVESGFGVGTLYWATAGDGAATGAVWSLGPEATDEPVIIASNRSAPLFVLPEPPNLYWFEEGKDSSGPSVEVLVEMSMTGGPITRIQTFDADDVPASIGGYYSINALFWSTGSDLLGNQSTAKVVEFPLSGHSEPLTRISGPDAGGAGAIGLDSRSLGLLYSAPNAIVEFPLALDGGLGTPQTLVATDGFVDDIENDENSVYFIDRSTGQLLAVPRPGADATAPRILASFLDPATALELDGECLYWIDAPAATVMMVKK